MAYRLLKDIKNVMLKAIIELGAKHGVMKVTAQKIADRCDISTFTVFEHFQTKQNFLDCAALAIDTPRIEKTIKMVKDGLTLEEIWDSMLEDLVMNPADTLYYISYTNTFGFDITQNNPRSKEYLSVAKTLFSGRGNYSEDEYLLMWDYVTSMVFYYSEKIIHGYIANTEATKEMIKNVVFYGVFKA